MTVNKFKPEPGTWEPTQKQIVRKMRSLAIEPKRTFWQMLKDFWNWTI